MIFESFFRARRHSARTGSTTSRAIFAACNLFLFTIAPAYAQIRLTETGGGAQYISLQAPATLAGNLNWIFPSTDGTPNQCLATNGSQTLQWRTVGGPGYSLDANDGSPANAVYVEANGRVGIGTTSPTAGTILDMNGSGATGSSFMVPRDTTANRPATGVNGMIRYNTTTNKFETYQNGVWLNITGGLMGKLEWPGTASCVWTNTAPVAYANFAAVGACPAPTATSGATAPGTKIPAIVINNLPPGDYEVTAAGMIQNISGSCRFRMSDGGTGSGIIASNNAGETSGTLTSFYSYSTTATRTFNVQVQNNSGSANACQIVNSSTTLNKFEMWVRRL